MSKWTIRIANHPCVGNGTYVSQSITEIERFVGKNDIQKDHIEEIVRHGPHGEKRLFACESIECVSSTKVILSKKD